MAETKTAGFRRIMQADMKMYSQFLILLELIEDHGLEGAQEYVRDRIHALAQEICKGKENSE